MEPQIEPHVIPIETNVMWYQMWFQSTVKDISLLLLK